MKYSKKHPECMDDEVFLGNFDTDGFESIEWLTKCKGNISFAPDGTRISTKWRECFPIFVKKSELPQDIEASIEYRNKDCLYPVEY